ncbi:MAG: Na(+)-translocating NADH-quinone reductase subunit A [Muribaculaceae bacterium]|nr:Na(+)-translocating NADH-quinone reductase subunit A [Muribaculaceae bacterium]
MAKHIKIQKGLDIPLSGVAVGVPRPDTSIKMFGIIPDDYPGIKWKSRVKAGDKVEIGDKLLSDKDSDSIWLVSPVSGTIKEIERGERRKILAVTIEKGDDTTSDAVKYDLTEEETAIRHTLQSSGLWALMRQRPFDIVPAADSKPRDIFITAFDTAPLAPAMMFESDFEYLEAGIKILGKLTSGKVYIGINKDIKFDSHFEAVEVTEFDGPHPAGNVGVQIAAIKPVNKGETVWTLGADTAVRIGKLYRDKKPNWDTIVAITGPAAKSPKLISTTVGAKAENLLSGEIEDTAATRIISGNVLTGEKISLKKGYLRYPWRQITLIEEGDHADEFMGWASLSPNKFSVKRSFPSFLMGKRKRFPFDARIKGGHRAMILSEEYDKVFPFDIYPEYLIKAILAGDIDKEEKLGIYEVAPEDFALPEFIDTSKLELQKIVREGLDKLRSEL